MAVGFHVAVRVASGQPGVVALFLPTPVDRRLVGVALARQAPAAFQGVPGVAEAQAQAGIRPAGQGGVEARRQPAAVRADRRGVDPARLAGEQAHGFEPPPRRGSAAARRARLPLHRSASVFVGGEAPGKRLGERVGVGLSGVREGPEAFARHLIENVRYLIHEKNAQTSLDVLGIGGARGQKLLQDRSGGLLVGGLGEVGEPIGISEDREGELRITGVEGGDGHIEEGISRRGESRPVA